LKEKDEGIRNHRQNAITRNGAIAEKEPDRVGHRGVDLRRVRKKRKRKKPPASGKGIEPRGKKVGLQNRCPTPEGKRDGHKKTYLKVTALKGTNYKP